VAHEPGGRNAADQLREIIGDTYDDGFTDIPAPTHWGSLPSTCSAASWEELRNWVEALQGRFAHLDHHVIPCCWWRHNEHVEALVALKDHERASFSETAPATAPVEWFRALRDISALLKAWSAELGCGAAHQDPPVALKAVDREQWDRHVTEDVRRRHEAEINQAADAQG